MCSDISEMSEPSNPQTANILIEVLKGDIAGVSIDAIGAVINSDLEIKGHLNTRLFEAAGPTLDDYILDNVIMPKEGEIFITPGFNLPAKCIIFAVLPQWRSDLDIIDQHLLSAIKRIVTTARKENIQAIALPLLCCGQGGYPKTRGVRLILQAVSNSFGPPLSKISFICDTDEAVEIYRKRLQP